MGSRGAAGAEHCHLVLHVCINLAMLALYAPSCRETWTGFSMDAFRELRRFTELAIPSAMMWWSFELVVLLSGLLPNPKLETSALSICLNTGSLMFMVPFGLCTAISTRVSNELGAGKP
uniref:Protein DETOXIFICATION n=1 Tax=Oryza nivara TaxID=4536 RepID=A0A0E0IQV3_ORYNI